MTLFKGRFSTKDGTAERPHRLSCSHVILINAFVYISIGLFAAYQSAFYAQQGISPREIGLLMGIAPLAAILIQPQWAKLADRTGKRKQVLITLCIGAATAMMLFYKAHGFWQYALVLLLLQAFMTSVVPMSDSIVIAETKRIQFPFAFVRMGGTLGYILIVLIAGFTISDRPSLMFPISAVMFIMFALLVSRLPATAKSSQKIPVEQKAKGSVFSLIRILNTELRFMLLIHFWAFSGLAFSMTYLGAYIVQLGYSQSLIGIVSSVSAIIEVPTLLILRRWKPDRSPIPRLALFCAMVGLRALLIGTGFVPTIIIAQLLQCVTYLPIYYICVTYFSEHLPHNRQSQGQGLLMLLQGGLGGLVGFVLGGWIANAIGLQLTYFLYGLAMIVGAAVFYMLYQRHKANSYVGSPNCVRAGDS